MAKKQQQKKSKKKKPIQKPTDGRHAPSSRVHEQRLVCLTLKVVMSRAVFELQMQHDMVIFQK